MFQCDPVVGNFSVIERRVSQKVTDDNCITRLSFIAGKRHHSTIASAVAENEPMRTTEANVNKQKTPISTLAMRPKINKIRRCRGSECRLPHQTLKALTRRLPKLFRCQHVVSLLRLLSTRDENFISISSVAPRSDVCLQSKKHV